jgi:hypothetical protein
MISMAGPPQRLPTRVPSRTQHAQPLRTAGGAAALLMVLALSACDFPTSLPRLETRIAFPMEGTRMTVTQFAPAGVTATPTAFQISVAASSSARSLAQMCGAPCVAVQGQQVPKPAFTDAFGVSTTMPADLISATLTGGAARVTVSHTFAFDPLRPPGSTQNGLLRIVLRSGGRELGRDSTTGPFTAPITRDIALAPGIVTGTIEAEVAVVSPAGGVVTIDNAAQLLASVQPMAITASEAQVAVQNRAVASETQVVDLTGVDDDIRNRAQRATVFVEIDNPFAVGGELQLRLHAPGAMDSRHQATLVPGLRTIPFELKLDEVRSLLGRNVELSMTGTVTQTAGPVTIRPGDALMISPRIMLFLEFGS